METDLNTIHVFKTNIGKIDTGCPMYQKLNDHKDIQQWSIDHDDIDCVLRIVSETLQPKQIITLIREFGHKCQELI
ncbi:hypothetical protein GJU43_07190 [Flavobacterium sp. LC2016-23]|uniref:hypothetical protein n=1 Tax=Flavobacterium sp. LC2016-23 TaxID=2666330 RepID=UPI0012AF8480|nr:hypothetical protein [Flavobacterium sp. LC2016-23]MRX39055.1 hypothetical protein [Flavobacterium sp. LC2016-23]